MFIDSIAGVSITSIVIGIRFFGALWASVGIAFMVWGVIDYMLSHGNAHHAHEGAEKIAKGFSILVGFAIAYAIAKGISYFLFG